MSGQDYIGTKLKVYKSVLNMLKFCRVKSFKMSVSKWKKTIINQTLQIVVCRVKSFKDLFQKCKGKQ